MDESDDAGRLTAAFVTNLNHELRTPLAAIIALTQVLEEELDGSALEFVRMIRSSGDRLNGSIEHMLAEVDEKARAAGS